MLALSLINYSTDIIRYSSNNYIPDMHISCRYF